MGTGGPFPEGKARPGRDADELVPRSWMSRSYTSSPPKRLHGVWRDCFTLTFTYFYWLDDRAIEVRSSAEARVSVPCTMGTGGSFSGGKARPERDADHSSPSSAEVVNE
jgi:hypothetical protein